VSSVNYTDDVPFSEEMFTRLGDTYRRIRNTLRILLGNLHDFEPGKQEIGTEDLTLVDRWILDRLQQVIEECRAAYAAYEFHKVYHTLNQFCAVDLSSLYVDITKDRMYCDAPGSRRRRATQMAMHQIFDALCRLLAPILAFTAEEAWGYLGDNSSVHLQCFPERQGNLRDGVVRENMEELLKLRGVIGQAIEKARQEKLIGNALEATVALRCDQRFATDIPREELEEFFILSDLKLEAAEEPGATVSLTPHKKCGRCWRHRETVGAIAGHPDLCDRCAEVMESRS
ncbi:MAG: class I tRNA ligase family protein, partial [Verrucomicrobiota bacterium]|nr:class I tRNA ligase family protein [Verrucomicrobiota bacterium]